MKNLHRKARIPAGKAPALIILPMIILFFGSCTAGQYKGHWIGEFIITETESDNNNKYISLAGQPLAVTVDIDEPSAGAGHIRLRIREGIPFNDMIVPCCFRNGKLIVETETVILTGKRSYSEGTPRFTAKFRIRESGSADSPVITGKIITRLSTSRSELFK